MCRPKMHPSLSRTVHYARFKITRSSANAEEPCEHTVSWNRVECCTNVRRIAFEKACNLWVAFKVIQGHCRCCHFIASISLRTSDHPWKGRGPGHVIHLRILHPLKFRWNWLKIKSVKFCTRVGMRSIRLVMTKCPQVGVVKVTWRLNFLAISVNISKMVQDRNILTMKD